jgi:hypothetical protein
MEFTAPAHGDFTAECEMPAADAWRRFTRGLDKRGKSRLILAADIWADRQPSVGIRETYAALATS